MPESGAIDFYFDFSSPYGYFAAEGLEKVVAPFGRTVRWHPVLIGVVMQQTGARPLAGIPVKGDYMVHDCDRLARFMEIPWSVPEPFPVSTADAARAFYALERDNPDRAVDFAKATYRAYFGHGRDITAEGVLREIVDAVDGDGDAVLRAAQSPEIRNRLRQEIAESVERGVFGSPFVFVDGERFWGSDRLWMIKRWLKRGGW